MTTKSLSPLLRYCPSGRRYGSGAGLQSGTVRSLPRHRLKHSDSVEGRPRIQSSRSSKLGRRGAFICEHAVFFRIWACWIWQAGGDFWRNRRSPARCEASAATTLRKQHLADKSIASHVGIQVQILCGLAGIPTKGGATR
jgi:hypothetical protein